MIEDNGNYFCCNGCQGVYHLLSDEGLESFYDKVGDTKLAPPTQQYEDSSNFDAPAFYEKFVKNNSENFSEVSLIIEGIHCSACVWLNEKALHKMDGVIEASINFTNNKAHIIWDDDILKLSQIIDMIRAIGYNAYPYDASLQEAHANKQRKDYYLRISVALFASMNVMWIAVAQYAGYFSGIEQEMKTILNVAEGILATPVLFYSGWIFFRGAYFGLKNKVINMDLLVATGATLTYFYSIYITVVERGEAYFDSVSMIITFVLIGKFLEVLSKKSATDTLDTITKHLPSEANILKDDKVVSVKLEDVAIGDIVLVSSGEKVLLDGEVINGEGNFDESSLTGESDPIYKSLGSKVISGTTSIDADIQFKATKDFEHSTLANLVSLLENAINKKPKIEQIANRLSEHFSTAILFLSFTTFMFWYFYAQSGFEYSFMIAIAVIVIACPCALGLATPVATLVGLSLGAKKGILFKEAQQLETMAKANVLVVDKTGTLTYGKPEVIKVHKESAYEESILYSLLKRSKHPIAKGVYDSLSLVDDEIVFEKYTQVQARGIVAYSKGVEILGGNLQLMKDYGIEIEFQTQSSLFLFAINKKIVAIFELDDRVKEGANSLVTKLKSRNIETIMLTGDHKLSAQKVASEVAIENYHYNLTPEDKLKFIEKLQADKKIVVMVGDGVNDILALAKADIGIVMGSGSDIAIDVGDVVLLDDSLKSLIAAFAISKTTFFLIKQNFAISLVYNALTIPLAMAGYVIPLIAAISMSLSSLLVVGNSMRIRYKWSKM
jgi:Cu+-exporting ATPase